MSGEQPRIFRPSGIRQFFLLESHLIPQSIISGGMNRRGLIDSHKIVVDLSGTFLRGRVATCVPGPTGQKSVVVTTVGVVR